MKTTIDPAKSIPAFYAGQSIFLTGGTGFLGKVFIEKLLRSCPEIREIFLLIRPKKGMSVRERLEKIISLEVFDRVRDERPASFEKLIPIAGDASMKELGISPADRQTLIERVTVVVHASASVRFHESLKYAVFLNVRATRDICILAANMKNLVALVYISTTYTYTDEPIIKEKTYPPKGDWRKTIEIAETMDEYTLNIFTTKYMGKNVVNTYVFTKSLAESIMKDYSTSLPCVIYRTSMVLSAMSEPFPGWLDNLYGPLGTGLAISTGILHVVLINPDARLDIIPVDVVVKSLIHIIWKRGLITYDNQSHLTTQDSVPLVFHGASGNMKEITASKMFTAGLDNVKIIPLENTYWPIGHGFTQSFTLYYILFMLLQMMPALLTDLLLKCIGRKPILVKLERIIFIASSVLRYFGMNSWIFDSTNAIALNETIPSDDAKEFKHQWASLDLKEYMASAIHGGKKFHLREDPSPARIAAIKVRIERMELIFRILKSCAILGMLWMIYKWNLLSFFIPRVFQFSHMYAQLSNY